jgi:hypothetical protein
VLTAAAQSQKGLDQEYCKLWGVCGEYFFTGNQTSNQVLKEGNL